MTKEKASLTVGSYALCKPYAAVARNAKHSMTLSSKSSF